MNLYNLQHLYRTSVPVVWCPPAPSRVDQPSPSSKAVSPPVSRTAIVEIKFWLLLFLIYILRLFRCFNKRLPNIIIICFIKLFINSSSRALTGDTNCHVIILISDWTEIKFWTEAKYQSRINSNSSQARCLLQPIPETGIKKIFSS